ncbi:ATP/GTP-binding protein [Mucilaginibacter psychrotolerans]|uniref:NadR/Ttd14 AAA domain-containing protein n=1 Tax=Mucilaginibacter psychrotolerans TaxID=1524096 RepID=A0A4Y8S754_9SPHI|nr:ATP-binding protein [Mucilaginibacter psychrotolerans]TFF34576.1 hypothetical protein E2R66_21750 [Mucilaginibacter psychrotolerans]
MKGTQRIVFTGGEGVGKTSALLYLGLTGATIVRETASDYIRIQRALGNIFPYEDRDFEERILEFQLLREAAVVADGRVFLDRGWVDCVAYGKLYNWDINPSLVTKAERIKYDKVFFFHSAKDYGVGLMDEPEIRKSVEIGAAVRKAYEELGYSIIDVMPGVLTARVDFILNSLN